MARAVDVDFHWGVEDALAEALEVVLRDVRRTTTLEPIIEDAEWAEEPGTASALLGFAGDSGRRGVYVQIDAPLPERLVGIADIVQDEVTDELWGAWPVCPLHSNHPVVPQDLLGEAVWVCPETGQATSQIGNLEAR